METPVKTIAKYALIAFCSIALLGLVGIAAMVGSGGGSTKTDYAKMNLMNVSKACRSRQAIYEKYPSTLSDLIGADGNRPLIEGGERAIVDPWGNPYKYALLRSENDEVEPYVWSERIVEGKLEIIGVKYSKDMNYFWFETK